MIWQNVKLFYLYRKNIDNSEPPFQIVVEGYKTENIEIHNQITYNKIVKNDKRKYKRIAF